MSQRDEQGRIVRSKKWLVERVEILNHKIEDYETRIKNAKAEITEREAELNS